MTIAIATLVPSGIALAADSRTSAVGSTGVPFVSTDHASKVFLINGCSGGVTAGLAQIDGITIYRLVEKFKATSNASQGGRILIDAFVQFFCDKYTAWKAKIVGLVTSGALPQQPNWSELGLTFALATYEGEDAQLYRCQIDGATLTPSISLEATSDNPGPVVIGFIPTVWRLLMGYDIRLDTSQLSPTAQQALATLRQPVNYFTMELQDAIDFSRFLANTTILMQRFSYGEPAIVGGVIEIAVVLEDDSRFLHRKEVKA